MALPNSMLSGSETTAVTPSALPELGQLLLRAAKLAAEHGVPVEAFAALAGSAYLDAQPGLREELEHRELVDRLRDLRRRGRIGSA